MTKANGAALDETDFMGVTNNLLHSLFSQCTIALKGETVTPAADYYNYRTFFNTIQTYGSDAAVWHLTNGFWYLDDGDLLPCDPRPKTRKTRASSPGGIRGSRARRSNCTTG